MSINVTAEARITRPRKAVAAYRFDPHNAPEWIGGVREAEPLGEPPIGAGSRVRRVAKFLGRRIEFDSEGRGAPARRARARLGAGHRHLAEQ